MADKNGTSVTPASTPDETDTTQDPDSPRHISLKIKKAGLGNPTNVNTPPLEETQSDGIEDGIEQHASRPWLRRLLRHSRHAFYAVAWLLFTGWWIAGLILHRHDLGWLIPFLLYLAITLRIIFLYVPITVVTVPMRWIWDKTATPIVRAIPERWRTPASALLVIAVIFIGAFASPESADNTRANRAVSLVGLLLLVTILYFNSKDRKRVDWHPVIVGMLVQFIITLFVLRTKDGYDIFNFISTLATDLLDLQRLASNF